MSAYVLYKRNGGTELYWTGHYDRLGSPVLTMSAPAARKFAGAREAYNSGGNLPRLFAAFRAGRRPHPVALRVS